MIRSDIIRRIQSYLQTQYDGGITILAEEDDGDITPPCAVVRIGSSEDMGANQAIVWDFNVIVAVFHDADDTTIETAETDAAELFDELADFDSVIQYVGQLGLLVSAWHPQTIEAGRDENKWTHFQSYRLIAAPDSSFDTTPLPLLADRQDYTLALNVGQSLANGNTSSPAITTTNPDADIVTFSGGVKSVAGEFESSVPAIEDNKNSPPGFQSGETGMVLAANELKKFADSKGAAQGPKYLVQVAGRDSASLDKLLEGSGSNYYEDFLLPVIQEAGDLATNEGKTIDLPAVIFRQGEGGTSPATVSAYKSQLSTYRNQIQNDATTYLTRERELKFVSYQTSSFGGTGTISAEAQWQLHRDEDWFLIASPVYPIYAAGLYSQLDFVHLTSPGYAWLGVYEGQAYRDFVYYPTKPHRLQPESVTAEGQVVTIDFTVPNGDLVIDENLVPAVQDKGIKVSDDSGDLSILNIKVINGNQIQFDTNRQITTGGKVRFGLDYNFAGSNVTGGKATNLRDSNSETTIIDGVERNLYNWCLISDIDAPADTVAQAPGDSLWSLSGGEAYIDLRGVSDITELEDSPNILPDRVEMTSSTALSTNTTTSGDTLSGWAVVWIDESAHDSTTNSALIMGNKVGSFDSEGVGLHLSRQDDGNGNRLHKLTFYTLNGGVSQTEVLYLSADFVGWALVGFSMDAANNKRTVFCSDNAANGNSSFTDTNSFTGHATTASLEIGKGSYTHSATGSLGFQLSYAGFTNDYLEAAGIAEVIADAERRLGITLS